MQQILKRLNRISLCIRTLQVHWLAQRASQCTHTIPNDSKMQHSASDPFWSGPDDNLHINQSLIKYAHYVISWANHRYVAWGTDPRIYLHSKYESLCTYALCHPFFWQRVQDVHTWRLIVIPRPWPVTNLIMYSTHLTCAVIFGIDNGVESIKLVLLASFMLN